MTKKSSARRLRDGHDIITPGARVHTLKRNQLLRELQIQLARQELEALVSRVMQRYLGQEVTPELCADCTEAIQLALQPRLLPGAHMPSIVVAPHPSDPNRLTVSVNDPEPAS